MRYLITLEGRGGLLDQRTCETEDEIHDAVRDQITDCTLAVGDTIRIIDTTPEAT